MRSFFGSLGIGLICLGFFPLCGCGSGSDAESKAPAASIPGDAAQAKAGASNENGEAASDKPELDPKHPIVEIDTSLGPIKLKLDAENAPLTVDNFLAYVDEGHYDQTIFHQVLEDYVVLGGAYTSDFVEKQTHTPIRNEAHNGLSNRRGTIAMARRPDAIDSATCQFYLNLNDNPVLDHKDRSTEGYGYCVFGEVVEGMEVVDRIGQTQVHDTKEIERTPVETVMINSIRRLQ